MSLAAASGGVHTGKRLASTVNIDQVSAGNVHLKQEHWHAHVHGARQTRIRQPSLWLWRPCRIQSRLFRLNGKPSWQITAAVIAGVPQQHHPSQAGGQRADSEDSGYWDMVYLLYPEAAEAAGLGLLHELVSSWPLIERTLAVQQPLSSVSPASVALQDCTTTSCKQLIDITGMEKPSHLCLRSS
jgi:hypothetical protein